MNLLLIVRRSLRQHLLSTIITALSIALAGGLLIAVWVIKAESQSAFTQVNSGFDAVLGARGSKLQLVLNAIFHLEASPGNVPQADYQFIKHHPAVKRAIPLAVGDNLRGYRIVGTDPELFTDIEYAPGKKFTFAAGHLWADGAKEAVVGSFAAQKLGLKPGDMFHPFHGLSYDERNQHAETYVVAGVLAPSNTPIDKVVWIPLHGIQTMSGHDPKTATDVSAVLIQLRAAGAGFQLDLMYNKQGNRLTFAYPIAAIMGDLFAKIGWFDRVLALVAYLVALVATFCVFVAIYNSMSARQRDIAILRSLGARRRTVFSAIILEAAAIGTFGMLGSAFVYGAIVSSAAAVIRAQTGVLLDPWFVHPVMLWAPGGMITLCALGGVLPAWKAYRTDIAATLAPVS
ncbi:MAG: FtsX-like permease family protein [Opitutaceae bacterium]|nr:FtsX-like permease family protein [Opitutaceae bacterium]